MLLFNFITFFIFSFNPKNLVSKIKLFLPKLRFDSDYKLNGRILNLALNGNGKSMMEIGKCPN